MILPARFGGLDGGRRSKKVRDGYGDGHGYGHGKIVDVVELEYDDGFILVCVGVYFWYFVGISFRCLFL